MTTKTPIDWTQFTWRCLCLLVITSALALLTGLWWLLPPVVQGVGIASGLTVTLLHAIAGYADSGCRSSRKQTNA